MHEIMLTIECSVLRRNNGLKYTSLNNAEKSVKIEELSELQTMRPAAIISHEFDTSCTQLDDISELWFIARLLQLLLPTLLCC